MTTISIFIKTDMYPFVNSFIDRLQFFVVVAITNVCAGVVIGIATFLIETLSDASGVRWIFVSKHLYTQSVQILNEALLQFAPPPLIFSVLRNLSGTGTVLRWTNTARTPDYTLLFGIVIFIRYGYRIA